MLEVPSVTRDKVLLDRTLYIVLRSSSFFSFVLRRKKKAFDRYQTCLKHCTVHREWTQNK